MPGRVQSVAITPDGKWAYVAQTNYLGRRVAVVDLISETPPPIIQLESADNPQCVAITPDPAPAADFTFTVGAAGSPTIFDASRSVSPVGTIAQYTWSFGDGTTDQSSDTPLVSHVYATVGTYTVELTVTNSAGTSVNKTFTGQMISNNGSSENAQLTQSVVVPPPSPPPTPPLPPSLFCGKIKKHHRISLKMRWNPTPSSNAVGYQICENNRKHTYTTTYETSKLHLKKHLHPKHYYKHHLQDYKKYLQNRYTLRAVNAEGEQSTSIQLHVK